jgi:predicted nucleotidyltransferase
VNSKEDILKYLSDNKEYLKKEYGITKIGLFGSFARDEAKEDSDIDIAIESKEHDFFLRYELQKVLEKEFNKSVDIGYISSFRTLIKKEIDKDIIFV